MRTVFWVVLAGVAGCGGSGVHGVSGFAGTYAATYSGSWQNSSPNTLSGMNTASASISVTDTAPNEVTMVWTLPPNPPSGSIIFELNGPVGTVKQGGAIGGNCFTGVIDGNQQTNCCDSCTVTFSGNTFSQPNAGTYTGTTPQGISYAGTYSGVWSGTRQ